MSAKLYYKHKTPYGNVRLFRWTVGRWTLYHIQYSDGHYYLELLHNGVIKKLRRTH